MTYLVLVLEFEVDELHFVDSFQRAPHLTKKPRPAVR